VRESASADPRGFLDAIPPPAVFDEVQHAPGILSYIKERIDASRSTSGQYILTGSQNLLLIERVTETLAGRAAMLRLLPLSQREADGDPHAPLPWEMPDQAAREQKRTVGEFWNAMLRGSYPELAAQPQRDAALWHASYVQTYLERDVRTLRQLGDLSQFQSFLRALAARNAQLLNLAELSRDIGVALNTAKAWLSVLEATFQVIVLRPYFENLGKRLVKTPKVYFTDVGTLCYLAGLRDAKHAAQGPMAGAIMETVVLNEIVKTLWHRGIEPQVYFWRTSAGAEIDILVAHEGRLVPIEVKASATPRPAMAETIRVFRRDHAQKAMSGYVVHPGNVRLPLAPGVSALPFDEL